MRTRTTGAGPPHGSASRLLWDHARRHWGALAGAAVVGFVVARLVKSGLAPSDESEDDRD